MATGGDQGGSIRIPAAACGIETHVRIGPIYGHHANGVHSGSYGTYGQDSL